MAWLNGTLSNIRYTARSTQQYSRQHAMSLIPHAILKVTTDRGRKRDRVKSKFKP